MSIRSKHIELTICTLLLIVSGFELVEAGTKDVDNIHACLEEIGPDNEKEFGAYDGDGISNIRVTITDTKDGKDFVDYDVEVTIRRGNIYGPIIYQDIISDGSSTGYVSTSGYDAWVILGWVDNGAYQYDVFTAVHWN